MIAFTFIMDFKGGTYINQLSAKNLKLAINVWAQNLDIKKIKKFNKISHSELIQDIQENTPIQLEGIKNVWCMTFSLKAGYILLNIVQTDLVSK